MSCLVTPATACFASEAPLPRGEALYAGSTLKLLKLALSRLPDIFIAAKPSSSDTPQDSPPAGALSQLYLPDQDAHATSQRDDSVPFDLWLVSQLVGLLAVAPCAEIHEAVAGVVEGLFEVFKERRDGIERHQMQEFLNAPSSSFGESGKRYPKCFFFLTDPNLCKPLTTPSPARYEIVVRTSKDCFTLQAGLLNIMGLTIKQSKFLPIDLSRSLWTLLCQQLRSPSAVNPSIGLEASFRTLAELCRSNGQIPGPLEHRLLTATFALFIGKLGARIGRTPPPDDASLRMDAALADFLTVALTHRPDAIASVASALQRIVRPDLFPIVRSSHLQAELLKAYAVTLRSSRYLDPAIATLLLDFVTTPDLRKSIALVFVAGLPPADTPPTTASAELRSPKKRTASDAAGRSRSRPVKRPKYDRDDVIVIDDDDDEDLVELDRAVSQVNTLWISKIPSTGPVAALASKVQSIIRVAADDKSPSERGLQLVDGAIDVLVRCGASAAFVECIPVLETLLMRMLREVSALIAESGRASPKNIPPGLASRMAVLCKVSFLACAAPPGSAIPRIALWVLSLPWMKDIANPTSAPQTAKFEALAKRSFFTLHTTVPFSAADVAAPKVASGHIAVDESLMAACIQAIAALPLHRDELPDKWVALLVGGAIAGPAAVRIAGWRAIGKVLAATRCEASVQFLVGVAETAVSLDDPPELLDIVAPSHCTVCDGPLPAARTPTLVPIATWGPFWPLLENRAPAQVRVVFARIALPRLFRHAPSQDLNCQSSALARSCIKFVGSGVLPLRMEIAKFLPTFFTRFDGADPEGSAILESNRSVIINELKVLIDSGKASAQDGVIAAAGSLGRIADDALLELVLYFLIEQLASKHELFRAFATEQASEQIVKGIAKHRRKTPLELMTPFLQPLSLYLIGRMKSSPLQISTLVAILNISEKEFYSLALPYILPHLVLDENALVMEDVARTLDRTMTEMIIDEGGHILAHLFMQDKREIDGALMYFHKTASEGAQGTITISDLLGSVRLLLLTNLAVELGDAAAVRREKAVSALNMVKTKLQDKDKQAPSNLSSFLRPYVLGILSHFNKNVVDHARRKTVADKIKIVRSLGQLILLVGPGVSEFTSQIMAMLQTMLEIRVLRSPAIDSWTAFLRTLRPVAIGPILSQVAVILTASHASFTKDETSRVRAIFEHLYIQNGPALASSLSVLCLLPSVPDFAHLNEAVKKAKAAAVAKEAAGSPGSLRTRDPMDDIGELLAGAAHDNVAVCRRALVELRHTLEENRDALRASVLSESVDPTVNDAVRVLLETCRRFKGTGMDIQLLCCECLGILGAVDPDRLDVVVCSADAAAATANGAGGDLSSFDGVVDFACMLIERQLAPAFRSAHNTKMQDHLAFAIQELLRFCGFTSAVVEDASDARSDT
ncbi:hypothetical protein BDK51DRAFT_26198, partial [Blyttiomyces helicus]